RGAKGTRILGVDPAFDGMAVEANVLLLERKRRARGDADLLDDEVDAGDHLGHGMLDLEPGIHLDEEELPALVQELDSAHAAIAHLAHRLRDGLPDACALIVVERRRQRLLPELLMATLQRAVALAKMNGVACAVPQHLDLDMAGVAEIFLEINGVVAKAGLGLDQRRGQPRIELLLDVSNLHATAAAAGSRLDQNGIADVGGDSFCLGKVGNGTVRAGHKRQAKGLRRVLGLDLVTHQPHMLGARADKGDLMLFEDLGKAGILREKAIARMHGVGASDLASRDDLRNVEIAVLGGGGGGGYAFFRADPTAWVARRRRSGR